MHLTSFSHGPTTSSTVRPAKLPKSSFHLPCNTWGGELTANSRASIPVSTAAPRTVF